MLDVAEQCGLRGCMARRWRGNSGERKGVMGRGRKRVEGTSVLVTSLRSCDRAHLGESDDEEASLKVAGSRGYPWRRCELLGRVLPCEEVAGVLGGCGDTTGPIYRLRGSLGDECGLKTEMGTAAASDSGGRLGMTPPPLTCEPHQSVVAGRRVRALAACSLCGAVGVGANWAEVLGWVLHGWARKRKCRPMLKENIFLFM